MVTKKITSLQHPLVKHWVQLRQNRDYREEKKEILVAGKKMAGELPIHTLISVEPLKTKAKEAYLVTEEILQKITGLRSTDGVAAALPLPAPMDLRSKSYLLILDEISDPGNLGTLIRTALGLGWDGVVLTPNTVDPFNDKALRASKGAIFHLPYMYASHEELAQFKHHFFTADLKGASLEKAGFTPPLALILSNEGSGPGKWSKALSKKVTIPMQGIESFNVATSGAILLYAMRPS
jgi:RNA methyltransferase, TrmH family